MLIYNILILRFYYNNTYNYLNNIKKRGREKDYNKRKEALKEIN